MRFYDGGPQPKLKEILAGDPSRETIQLGTDTVRVWKVGTGPGKMVAIHPITQEDLRLDGTGVQDGIKWTDLPDEVRSVLTLAVTSTEEIKPTSLNRLDTIGLFNMLKDQGLAALRIIAPVAIVQYEERSLQKGGLPILYRLRGGSHVKQIEKKAQ